MKGLLSKTTLKTAAVAVGMIIVGRIVLRKAASLPVVGKFAAMGAQYI